MADIHIDDFCRDAALTLLHLYSAFPRRTSLYVEDIAGPDEPDDVGLHSDRHMACLGTMLWLAEEGYIRYEAMVYQDGIDQAVLTGRSFTLLSSLSDVRYEDPAPEMPAATTATIHELASNACWRESQLAQPSGLSGMGTSGRRDAVVGDDNR